VILPGEGGEEEGQSSTWRTSSLLWVVEVGDMWTVKVMIMSFFSRVSRDSDSGPGCLLMATADTKVFHFP
jgi:hypothetical protein